MLKKAAQQGRSERRGGRYVPHFVWAFALAIDLGERKSPSSVSDLLESSTRVEPLSEARTPLAGFFSILLGTELNALGQRQIVTPVGGVRLPPHIGFPGIRAGFAP